MSKQGTLKLLSFPITIYVCLKNTPFWGKNLQVDIPKQGTLNSSQKSFKKGS